jgi:hypothetical protein
MGGNFNNIRKIPTDDCKKYSPSPSFFGLRLLMDASSAVFTLFLVRVDFEGKVQRAISDQTGEDENDPQQADIPDSSVQNKKQR